MELVRTPLDVHADPRDVLRALRGDRAPFALVGTWAGGQAVLGSEPLCVVDDARDPFALLDELPPWDGDDTGDAVGGGWFGHLGFGLGGLVEELPAPPPRPHPRPTASLGFYDHVLRQDRDGGWWFEALSTPGREATLHARLADLRGRLARPPASPRPWRLRGMRPRPPGYEGHRTAVADCVERIAAGEIFQANLCLRLDGELDGSPLDAFADAWGRVRPAYGAYVEHPGGAVLTFSPELFLRRRGRLVRTAPIKGTVPRAADAVTAHAQARALAASAKDRAEHVMIVDLMRNDLGRVAGYGTVTAAPAPDLQAHPGVWHLVSTVEARLRDGVGDADLLRATFPPGSVTGAPKVQALHVITALEGSAREVYTGAVGFASPVAGLELNVAIRTFEVHGRHVWFGCGGGVVADSDPDAELAEALAKARPLVEALGGTVLGPPATRPVSATSGTVAVPQVAVGDAAPAGRRRPSRLPAPLAAPRPDRARGVLETIAVRDGRAVELGRHLERLAASAAELYGATLPDGLAGRVEALVAGRGLGRVRVSLMPGGDPVVCVGGTAPAAATTRVLRPVCVPGGLGAHKWADRRLVAAHEDQHGTALIVDADGAVLEAGSANVWILEGGRLITPPADGRLLTGIVRARILEAGAAAGLSAAEEPLGLDRLRAADAVVLTSSVRVAAPAQLEDTSGHTPAAAHLAAALRAELAPAGVGSAA